MKVVAVNGSSRKKGNTAFALATVCEVLEAQGIQTERIEIGHEALHGCIGCGTCGKKADRRCNFADDPANGWIQSMLEADGLLIGTPVYFAGVNGALKSLLDRAFSVANANGHLFRHKVGASVAAVRRAGFTTALEQINKYFSISEMFMPAGNYWNGVFGMNPGEAAGDPEGVQCMRVLGANMAWLMKVIEHGRGAIPPPARAVKVLTNFIR